MVILDVDAVMDDHHSVVGDPVMFGDHILRMLRSRNDAVSGKKAASFFVVDILIRMASRAVEFGSMHVDEERAPRNALCLDAGTERKPVVCVDDIVCFFAGDDARLKSVAPDLVKKVESVESAVGCGTQILVVKVGGNVRVDERFHPAHLHVADIRKNYLEKIVIETVKPFREHERDRHVRL